jgi:hypothetical protein
MLLRKTKHKIKKKIEKHGACTVCVVRKWLWRMSTSRTRQVSTKVNCETCKKLRQRAQRSAAVREQCGSRSYSGAAEQKVWDSLPARVCGRSREDLLLSLESDHGTLKHQPFFLPRKFGCLLGTLSNIPYRFLLPYFLGRIFS